MDDCSSRAESQLPSDPLLRSSIRNCWGFESNYNFNSNSFPFPETMSFNCRRFSARINSCWEKSQLRYVFRSMGIIVSSISVRLHSTRPIGSRLLHHTISPVGCHLWTWCNWMTFSTSLHDLLDSDECTDLKKYVERRKESIYGIEFFYAHAKA